MNYRDLIIALASLIEVICVVVQTVYIVVNLIKFKRLKLIPWVQFVWCFAAVVFFIAKYKFN